VPKEYFIPSNLAEVGYELVREFPEDIQKIFTWLYSDSMNTVWWFLVAVSLAGLLFALLARNEVLGSGLAGKQTFEEPEKVTDPEPAVKIPTDDREVWSLRWILA